MVPNGRVMNDNILRLQPACACICTYLEDCLQYKRFNNIHITMAYSLTHDLEKLPSKLYALLFLYLFFSGFCSAFKHQKHDGFKVQTDENMLVILNQSICSF